MLTQYKTPWREPVVRAPGIHHSFHQPVCIREAGEHRVVDIMRPDYFALVVCVECGLTWDEGAELPDWPYCKGH